MTSSRDSLPSAWRAAAWVVSAFCIVALPVEARQHDAAIDSLVAAEALSRGVPGVAVVIVSGGSIVVQRGYGTADRATGRPVTAATPFNIASVTKPFTALLVQMLVSEGKVQLDVPASRYLPLPAPYRALTVRQLLNHTSGIARDLREHNDDDPDSGDYRRRLDASAPSARPGERFEYSNTGYTVLGWLVEAVEGEPLAAVLRRRVFEPAELRQAGYRLSIAADPARARPYHVLDGAARDTISITGGFGSGGMSLSAADFAAYAVALQQGRLLAGGAAEVAWKPGRLLTGAPARVRVNTDADGYGFGWFLTTYGGHRLVTHGGGITGYGANVYHFPDAQLTIAVLANSKARDDGMAPVDPLARRLADWCLAREACRPPAAVRDLRDTVVRLNRGFSAAYVRGDTLAIRRMYTDDALALPPHGRAVAGAAPLARLFGPSRSLEHLDHVLYTEWLNRYGDVVVEMGTWYDVWGRDEERRASSGRYLLTWIREDGRWRIAADGWSSGFP
jgi:CubicO group peptidase (beta-lactamase class C family)/ketosteroid isomerase-like protein